MKRFLIETLKAVALIAIGTVVTIALSPNINSRDVVATLVSEHH